LKQAAIKNVMQARGKQKRNRRKQYVGLVMGTPAVMMRKDTPYTGLLKRE